MAELNFFRMVGLMSGHRVEATSSGAVPLNTILASSVRQDPDIDALATRAPGEAAVLIWNYQDEDVPSPGSDVGVSMKGIPASVHRVLLQHYRIDDNHSNAYTVWMEMGSPQDSTVEHYVKLQAAGQLELLDSPRWITPTDGEIKVKLQLPRQGLSLLRVTWAGRQPFPHIPPEVGICPDALSRMPPQGVIQNQVCQALPSLHRAYISGTGFLHSSYWPSEADHANSVPGYLLRPAANAVVSCLHFDSHAHPCARHWRNHSHFFAHSFGHAQVPARCRPVQPLSRR